MASTEPTAPRQGEIWLVSFGAAHPGEPGKTRPAVVISANGQFTGSVHDLAIVVPLSSSLSPTLTRPLVHASPRNGLDADSVVVARAIRGVSLHRLVRHLGVLDNATVTQVRTILDALLSLPEQ